jgi:hypothetical protein
LAQAFRVLRPEGALILTVPFAARYHFIPFDYWRFTPSALQKILSGAGFSNIAVYARGNALTVACYKLMAVLLPLFFAPARSTPMRFVCTAFGIALSPLIVTLAAIANTSMLAPGGDDCLGYTVLAFRTPD